MKRAITTVTAAVLMLGVLTGTARAQQANKVALVYKLMLDQRISVVDIENLSRAGVIGDLLGNGQRVITDENTRAAIRFTDDASILRMNPNTEMVILAEGDRSALQKTLRIDLGEMWARINKNPDATYRIETPTAVAAVKGTEFYIRVDADGTTTIMTTEGVLDFFNGVGTVEVPAGSTGQIGTAAAAPSVGETTPEEIESFGGITEDVEKKDDDMVEIVIPFVDANGNQKTMTLRLPRSEAQKYLPPQGA